MIYEVRATLFFEEADEADDFFHDCQTALPKSIVVHPCEANMEFGTIDKLECHHEEDPNAPCHVIEHDDNEPVCPLPETP